jgi:cystathionine beta-lyase
MARDRKLDTRLIQAGRDPEITLGGVNPVIQRASTILVDRADQLYAPGVNTYGIHGTATHDALKEAMRELENAVHCQLVPSGLLACTIPILAIASPGAHILVTDNCYGPTRRWCERTLKRWGVETEFFDPRLGPDISDLFRPETKLVFIESPGSLTFELSDTPAICAVARMKGIKTCVDNTWSAGVYHHPLEIGADIVAHATSKYPSGGADVLSGAILTNDDALQERIYNTVTDLGLNTSPDDAYLVLRGLRTMVTRLERHSASGMKVAEWLAGRPEVKEVLHPALPSSPDHKLWKRDFTGAAGLFGVTLEPATDKRVNAMLDALELFGLGFSWGGYESLITTSHPQVKRTARKHDGAPLLRLSIGLEDPGDLIADLDKGLAALRA